MLNSEIIWSVRPNPKPINDAIDLDECVLVGELPRWVKAVEGFGKAHAKALEVHVELGEVGIGIITH